MNKVDPVPTVERSQKVNPWKIRLYFLSRNSIVLFSLAFLILLGGVGIAWKEQKPAVQGSPKEQFKVEAFRDELAAGKPDAAAVMRMLPQAALVWQEDVPADAWIEASRLSPTEKLVAASGWTSFRSGNGFEPSADLLYYAHYVNPLRHANELIGDHYAAQKDFSKAVPYYQREAAFPDATIAREKLVTAAVKARNRDALRALAANPEYVKEFRPEHRLYLAAQQKRWGDLSSLLKEILPPLNQPLPMKLALGAGLVWLIIALQAIQPGGIFSLRPLLPLLGVAAGLVSAFPALLGEFWIEEMMGLRRTGNFIDDCLYFMGNLGPREELAKLALFFLISPIVLIRGKKLEMLVTAGSVGLGFAFWENLVYFKEFGPSAAFPRFLTSTFFHFALTGLNGLAFCEWVRNPLRGFLPFAGTLLLTIAGHGAYETLASLEHLQVTMLAAMIIYMLVALWFFRKLRVNRNGARDRLSIGATFVIGVSALAAIIFTLASRETGFDATVATFSCIGFGMVMVTYMFYWQLGEGMSASERAAAMSYFR